LDHHHLLSEDIGAWPKQFGLQLFATLKEDLTLMVKSTNSSVYNQALSRLRTKLQHNPDGLGYLEDNIHSKRHLFANHIIKTYPCNLERQGNVPAEGNHSSIIQRVGRLVFAPVKLVEELLQRHSSISSERALELSKRHLTSLPAARKAKSGSDREAILRLSSWGLEIYQKSKRTASKLELSTGSDGSCRFTVREKTQNPWTLGVAREQLG